MRHFSYVQFRAARLPALLFFILIQQVWYTSAQAFSEPIFPKPDPSQTSTGAGGVPRPGMGHEDWSSLALGPNDLSSERPVLGEKDEYPEFTRELIEVQWRENDPIYLYVVRPHGVEKPPVILYLYSYPYDTPRFLNEDFCQRVTAEGFGAIGFVSALTGQRYHSRPMREWFVSELQEALVISVHDVQMVLNFLSDRGDFDMNRVGMLGEGSGATIAILAAAVDARIRALDLVNPWGDWPDWMDKSTLVPAAERPNYVKPEFLHRVEPFDPVRWLPKLGSKRIRLQDIMDDSITPEVCKKQIESVAPRGAQIIRYDDSLAAHKALAGGQLFKWIKQQVGVTPLQTTRIP